MLVSELAVAAWKPTSDLPVIRQESRKNRSAPQYALGDHTRSIPLLSLPKVCLFHPRRTIIRNLSKDVPRRERLQCIGCQSIHSSRYAATASLAQAWVRMIRGLVVAVLLCVAMLGQSVYGSLLPKLFLTCHFIEPHPAERPHKAAPGS